MFPASHLRLAVSALAATILCSAPGSAQPLAMNDPGFFPFPGSIFQQVVREPAPQAYGVPEESVTEEPAGVMPERFRRQTVAYNGSEAPGTIVIDTPNTYLYYVLGGGRAIRYGIGVGREGFTWAGPQAGMAGLASAGGDDRAPALSAALHGRRPGQSARRARHVPR
jgi:lipoprotein-anchoring transpeptidase ErfK/SrfK